LIGRIGANGGLIGRLMPHSPRTGRWLGSADGNARLINRLGASRRFSFDSGRVRLEPAAGAAGLMGMRGSFAGSAKAAGFRSIQAESAWNRPLARLG
jgi:hypothetical protein